MTMLSVRSRRTPLIAAAAVAAEIILKGCGKSRSLQTRRRGRWK
ncbi:hypothetical protein R80B4_00364 [Fibrobacteres bacterium R8-0-B4]